MVQGQAETGVQELYGLEMAEHMPAAVVVLVTELPVPVGLVGLVVVLPVQRMEPVHRLVEPPLEMGQATPVGVVVELVLMGMAGTVVLGLLSLSQPKMVSVEHKVLLTPVVEHLQPNLMLL